MKYRNNKSYRCSKKIRWYSFGLWDISKKKNGHSIQDEVFNIFKDYYTKGTDEIKPWELNCCCQLHTTQQVSRLGN